MTLRLNGHHATDIETACQLIRTGQLVAMPTETVYGCAGDALNPASIAAIFSAKERPAFDPLIVHISQPNEAQQLAEVSHFAQALMEAFWPGALTLVLPRKPIVPDLVTSGLDYVGLRCPAHPIAQQLLQQSKCFLAAPSANKFGSISPVTSDDVFTELNGCIAAILDGGRCTRGLESTVARPEVDGSLTLLRLGALSPETIQQHFPDCTLTIQTSSSNPGKAHISPGMAERHYAPNTPLYLHHHIPPSSTRHGKSLLLMQADAHDTTGYAHVCDLSSTGNSLEAARNLFRCLRDLDQQHFDAIDALRLPEAQLGKAINDRLQRASFNTH